MADAPMKRKREASSTCFASPIFGKSVRKSGQSSTRSTSEKPSLPVKKELDLDGTLKTEPKPIEGTPVKPELDWDVEFCELPQAVSSVEKSPSTIVKLIIN